MGTSNLPYHITLQPISLTVVTSHLCYSDGIPPPPPPPPLLLCIRMASLWVYIKMMRNSSACCWSTSAGELHLSHPPLLIFNYSKAGQSPAGLSLQSRLAKPGPASWLGTQVTKLWSAALAGAPLAGSLSTGTQACGILLSLSPFCCQSVNQSVMLALHLHLGVSSWEL